MKRSFPLSKVYALLEPGPVVLISTHGKDRPNVMTMSWHMMIDFEPPIVGCIVSNRNYSFDLLKRAKDCVINIPTEELAHQVVKCGNTTGRTKDKFKAFNLTPEPASRVSAPLISECYANLECKISDRVLVEKYNLFILEVVKAWIDPAVKEPRTLHHRGNGRFMIAGQTIKLPSRKK